MEVTIVPSRIFIIGVLVILLCIILTSVSLYEVEIATIVSSISAIYVGYLIYSQSQETLVIRNDSAVLNGTSIINLKWRSVAGLYLIMQYQDAHVPHKNHSKVLFFDSIRGATAAELLRSQYV